MSPMSWTIISLAPIMLMNLMKIISTNSEKNSTPKSNKKLKMKSYSWMW